MGICLAATGEVSQLSAYSVGELLVILVLLGGRCDNNYESVFAQLVGECVNILPHRGGKC